MNYKKCILIIVFFMLVALVGIFAYKHTPKSTAMPHDGASFLAVAGNLLAGKGLVTNAYGIISNAPLKFPFPYTAQPPLYPILIALITLALKIPLFLSARLVSLFSSYFSLALIFFLSRKLYKSFPLAFLITLFATFNLIFIKFSNLILSDGLFYFWHAGLACLILLQKDSFKKNIFAAILLGIICLTKYQGLITFVSYIAYIIIIERKKALKPILLVSSVFILVISPWIIRNIVVKAPSDFPYMFLQDFYRKDLPGWLSHGINTPSNIMEFARQNYISIIQVMVGKTLLMLKDIFLNLSFYLFVLSGLFLRKIQVRPKEYSWPYIFTITSIIFCTIHYESRYFLALFWIWILFCGFGLAYFKQLTESKLNLFNFLVIIYPFVTFCIHQRANIRGLVGYKSWLIICVLLIITISILFNSRRKNKLLPAVLVIIIFVSLALENYAWLARPYVNRRYIINQLLGNYINNNLGLTQNEMIVTGSGTGYISYFTGKPTAPLPYATDKELEDFFRRYNVSIIAISQEELMTYRRDWARGLPNYIAKQASFRCLDDTCLIFKVLRDKIE